VREEKRKKKKEKERRGKMEEIRDIPDSLVCYEGALLVDDGGDGDDKVEEIKDDGGKKEEMNSKTTSGNVQTDEILDSILPPRCWRDEKTKRKYMQYTSKQIASRLDVISLQEQLEKKLIERQARDTGICPVREDLYKQAFDELIRHVVLNQPERGLLLLRMRDEVRMTIDAYKTLYESSVVFGVRKQLQAEEGRSDLEERIKTLEEECKSKRNQVLELRNKVEIIEKRESEVRALLEKKRKEEIDFLKYQGQNLDQFLKSISGGV